MYVVRKTSWIENLLVQQTMYMTSNAQWSESKYKGEICYKVDFQLMGCTK